MTLISSDRLRFPCEPWQLVETTHTPNDDDGTLETLMAIGNGHLGIRGARSVGGEGVLPGTFLNGFHETWEIKHAENAFGFARTGQRIVYVPDAGNFSVSIDGEVLTMADSTILDYRRSVDFSTGIYQCTVVWACRSGATVTTVARRAVGFDSRGCLGIELSISTDREVSADVTSAIINRQDRPVEEQSIHDPRRAGRHADRILVPLHLQGTGGSLRLAWETAASGQRVAMAVEHRIPGEQQPFETVVGPDQSTVRWVFAIEAGQTFRLEKSVSYIRGKRSFAEDRGEQLTAAAEAALVDVDTIFAQSIAHYQRYWTLADIVLVGQPELQQAVRWNLFQLSQATARSGVSGIPAKGVSGSGYEGHYFWDQEIYLLPYLTYTNPDGARNVLRVPASRCSPMPGGGPRSSMWTGRRSRGRRSTAWRPAPTMRPAPRISTSPRPSRSRPPRRGPSAMPSSAGQIGADLLVETAHCGCPWVLRQGRHCSISTGSPARTSTRRSSMTTCTPT